MAPHLLARAGMRWTRATLPTIASLVACMLAASASAQIEYPDGLPAADETVDLTTPRRALDYFQASATEGEWIEASRALDLRDVPRERRVAQGEAAARAIDAVLSDRGVRAEMLPDDAEPHGDRVIAVAWVPGVETGVVMRRIERSSGPVWVFSRTTVAAASELAAHIDRGPIGNLVPAELREPRFAGLEPWQWIGLALALVLAALLATITGRALLWLVWRAIGREETLSRVLRRAHAPVRVVATLAYLGLMAVPLHLPPGFVEVIGNVYVAAWLVAIGWLVLRVVDFIAELAAERAAATRGWRARMVRTRVILLRRALNATATVVLASILLLQFEPMREVGEWLLASAGVAGIVVGLAAQRAIGNLLAGVQLSFTQPLRVGDQVVIEGEFGTVEEVNLSYVVVRVWDQRCLIVPMTRLLESSFQNWTRATDDLIGDVLLFVDFATPIDRLRPAIETFVREHPFFDGRVVNVQLVDLTDRAAKLRVLVSAHDAGSTWKLRCDTREHILTLLQNLEGGRYLPRLRTGDALSESTLDNSGTHRLARRGAG